MSSYVFSWDGKTIDLRQFFVHESYRSKGVGKLILEGLLRYAKEIVCNRIDVNVSYWNERARGFCEKLGAVDQTDGYVLYCLYKDAINKFNA